MATIDPMRVAVVGATGMLGAPVARALLDQGFAVRAVVRDPVAALARVDARAELVKADVTDAETLPFALDGCDALYISLRGRNDVQSYEAIEVQGVRHLVDAARQSRVRRIAYISGAGRSAGLDRHFPVRIKRTCEDTIRGSGLPYTIFRPTHFMESLPMFVRGRRATVLGRQAHRYHYLAASDYARIVARSFLEPRAASTELTVFGPAPYTMREALLAFTRIALPAVRVDHLPLPLARTIASLTGNADLRFATELFAAFEAIGEEGDPAAAAALLGAATTSLEDWSRAWVPRRSESAGRTL